MTSASFALDRLIFHAYRVASYSDVSAALLLTLIDELFAYPAMTIAQAAKRLKVTPRSAQLNVDKLVRAGIVKEATGRQRNRVFVASEIIRIIEATQAISGQPERPT